MTARDDYPTLVDFCPHALDEIDRLRPSAALGREIEWEIDRYGDPYLMGVRARVETGDGFTQNEGGS